MPLPMTFLGTVATVLFACHPADQEKRTGRPGPSSSPSAAPTVSGRVVKTFPAQGVSRVVFRAAMAREARTTPAKGDSIVVSGTPQGGAPGYHPSDPKWRETSASEWGLDFKGKTFRKTLVISTFNEIHYIHHSYYLDDLVISVPSGVEVIREAREPSGDGAADLREPAVEKGP
jgi:hypothetical protein